MYCREVPYDDASHLSFHPSWLVPLKTVVAQQCRTPVQLITSISLNAAGSMMLTVGHCSGILSHSWRLCLRTQACYQSHLIWPDHVRHAVHASAFEHMHIHICTHVCTQTHKNTLAFGDSWLIFCYANRPAQCEWPTTSCTCVLAWTWHALQLHPMSDLWCQVKPRLTVLVLLPRASGVGCTKAVFLGSVVLVHCQLIVAMQLPKDSSRELSYWAERQKWHLTFY